MGFLITDLADEKHDLSVNYWNWRPTLEIISSFGVIEADRIEIMGMSFGGAEVTADEAHLIGQRIKAEILPRMSAESRMRLDLSVTNEPDDGTLHRSAELMHENYSATHSWLTEFADFCLSCAGFSVS